MNFSYKQTDNKALFSTLQDETLTNIEKIQNFIPIYTLFFKSIDGTNYNNFNLDHTLSLHKVIKKETENKYNAILMNDKMKQINKRILCIKTLASLKQHLYIVRSDSLLDQFQRWMWSVVHLYQHTARGILQAALRVRMSSSKYAKKLHHFYSYG